MLSHVRDSSCFSKFYCINPLCSLGLLILWCFFVVVDCRLQSGLALKRWSACRCPPFAALFLLLKLSYMFYCSFYFLHCINGRHRWWVKRVNFLSMLQVSLHPKRRKRTISVSEEDFTLDMFLSLLFCLFLFFYKFLMDLSDLLQAQSGSCHVKLKV